MSAIDIDQSLDSVLLPSSGHDRKTLAGPSALERGTNRRPNEPAHAALLAKLEQSRELTDADRLRLSEINVRTQKIAANQDIIREGESSKMLRLVLDGWACRYKLLSNGRRAIVGYLVTGDFCDLNGSIFNEMDHSVGALTTCLVLEIPRVTIEALAENYPRITRALWWCSLVEKRLMREWLVNMGKRSAEEQMACLLCELYLRLRAAGKVSQDECQFPLTQQQLSDTLGISAVHVNRILQQLRKSKLLTLQERLLTIPDLLRLQRFAGFTGQYLHLDAPAGRPEARALS